MKILITGGRGYLGSALFLYLKNEGFDVFCTSRHKISSIDRVYSFDSDDDQLGVCLADIDVLVHLAWTSTPAISNQSPLMDFQRNVMASNRLFNKAAEMGVKKIIFASSGGQIYGESNKDLISEDTCTQPLSAYGVGKLSCEAFLNLLARINNFDAISLRISNLYGAGQTAKPGFGVIPTFIEVLRQRGVVNIYGDGSIVRDYIYIDDVVDAVARAINCDKRFVGAINIGSSHGLSIMDILVNLERVVGRHATLQFHPARTSDPKRIVLDTSLADRQLNWVPKVGLDEGLKKIKESIYWGNF